jgi:DNA repair exonuclease SbcCD ATPase subunit
MENRKTKGFFKILIIAGLAAMYYFDRDEIKTQADSKHEELTEQVAEQTKQLQNLSSKLEEDKKLLKKYDDSLIKEIKNISGLIKSFNKKITDDKEKLQSASDDDNVQYFIDYTNQWSTRTGIK